MSDGEGEYVMEDVVVEGEYGGLRLHRSKVKGARVGLGSAWWRLRMKERVWEGFRRVKRSSDNFIWRGCVEEGCAGRARESGGGVTAPLRTAAHMYASVVTV